MLRRVMNPSGAYKIASRNRSFETHLDPSLRSQRRVQRIVTSLQNEIVGGGGGERLRIRRVIKDPREIFRLELDVPELGYQRTTLLDREALELLLQAEEVRALVRPSALNR
jgi:hypothetical protein